MKRKQKTEAYMALVIVEMIRGDGKERGRREKSTEPSEVKRG